MSPRDGSPAVRRGEVANTARDDLELQSSRFYAWKAAFTRARSLAWLARTGGRPRGEGIRILFYHRISDDHDELAVPPSRFRRQMDFLADSGYRVVDVAEVGRLLAGGSVPNDVIGLSFDDGYLDVAENALPVLARHGFRATVFVVTGAVEGNAVFTWYERQPALLSWQDITSLDGASPLRFEAHTVSHPSLLALDDAAAQREIVDCKHVLEDRLGRAVEAFSYPAGLFGPREVALVRQAEYHVAVSCEPGLNDPSVDRFALRRRQIDARDRLIDFRAKVAGGHDSPPPLRAAYRRLSYGAGEGAAS
jgi:peptidoglycan/xylan/chitin deacetylase (PgdA/CDA1 family)